MDLVLLSHLVQDARLSQRALARAAGMSAPAVAERVTRLERSGVIQGYVAQIDYSMLGLPMSVVVDINSSRSIAELELAADLVEIPEVERVDILTGPSDLQVRLRVRDQDHLNRVLFNTLLASSADIVHTQTHLCLSTFAPDNFAKQVVEGAQRTQTNAGEETAG